MLFQFQPVLQKSMKIKKLGNLGIHPSDHETSRGKAGWSLMAPIGSICAQLLGASAPQEARRRLQEHG